MFERLMPYNQIERLIDWERKSSALTSDHARRSGVKIAVIDDETFRAHQNLRNAGYEITEIGDIKSITELESYHIILCDLHGVGSHFNSRFQGGFIIDEIKKGYPEKFVVAYTGGSADAAVISYAQQAADDFVKKDVDINEWRDKLDGIIADLSDPVQVWRRQRDALVEADWKFLN